MDKMFGKGALEKIENPGSGRPDNLVLDNSVMDNSVLDSSLLGQFGTRQFSTP